MREYIIRVDENDERWHYVERQYTHFFGYPITEEVVRCRDCKHYYEAENYHPSGNYVRRCCKYFDTYNDEVEPDGFCAWGERRAV